MKFILFVVLAKSVFIGWFGWMDGPTVVGAEYLKSFYDPLADYDLRFYDPLVDQCNDIWLPLFGHGFSEEHKGMHNVKRGCLINGLKCNGKYCDNTKLKQSPGKTHKYVRSYTTEWFSEENGESYKVHTVRCDKDYFVTGMECRGAYCDDIRLNCTSVYDLEQTNDCQETYPDYRQLEYGRYISGIKCVGSYCDKKYVIACKTKEPRIHYFRAPPMILSPEHEMNN